MSVISLPSLFDNLKWFLDHETANGFEGWVALPAAKTMIAVPDDGATVIADGRHFYVQISVNDFALNIDEINDASPLPVASWEFSPDAAALAKFDASPFRNN